MPKIIKQAYLKLNQFKFVKFEFGQYYIILQVQGFSKSPSLLNLELGVKSY